MFAHQRKYGVTSSDKLIEANRTSAHASQRVIRSILPRFANNMARAARADPAEAPQQVRTKTICSALASSQSLRSDGEIPRRKNARKAAMTEKNITSLEAHMASNETQDQRPSTLKSAKQPNECRNVLGSLHRLVRPFSVLPAPVSTEGMSSRAGPPHVRLRLQRRPERS